MYIWGDKTLSFFDIWSIEHFISGITLGSMIVFIFNKSQLQNTKDYKLLYYVLIAFFAYLWEVIEHYLESGLINDAVTFWFHGVEFWGNRILTDPMLMILGAYLNLKFNALNKAARYFSTIWIYVHIFIFPHSMYLQELL